MNQHNAAKFRSQRLPITLLLEQGGDLEEVKDNPRPDPGLWGKKPPNEQIWSQTGHGGAALREDARAGFGWGITVVGGEGRGDQHPFPSQSWLPLLTPCSQDVYFGNTSSVCN